MYGLDEWDSTSHDALCLYGGGIFTADIQYVLK